MRCDVADEAQVAAAMAQTLAELGKVDSVFANAGVGGLAPFVDMSLAEWRRVMAVNLDGAFLTLREGARHLVERGEGGSLVAVSSVSAIHGAPRHGALRGVEDRGCSPSSGASRSSWPGTAIRCNAILPGWTETEMIEPGKANQRWVDAIIGRTPVRRWGVPGDFGAIAAYLADPALLFHTGDSIVLDGGYTVF